MTLAGVLDLPSTVLDIATQVSDTISQQIEQRRRTSRASASTRRRNLILSLKETLIQTLDGPMQGRVLSDWLRQLQSEFKARMAAIDAEITSAGDDDPTNQEDDGDEGDDRNEMDADIEEGGEGRNSTLSANNPSHRTRTGEVSAMPRGSGTGAGMRASTERQTGSGSREDPTMIISTSSSSSSSRASPAAPNHRFSDGSHNTPSNENHENSNEDHITEGQEEDEEEEGEDEMQLDINTNSNRIGSNSSTSRYWHSYQEDINSGRDGEQAQEQENGDDSQGSAFSELQEL